MKKRVRRNISPSTVLLIRQIIIGFLIVAFFSMLIITVWYGSRVDSFTLSTVTVRGGETIPHSEVEGIVRTELEGTYLKLVPRVFAFTYPQTDIEESIKAIKRIKHLDVERKSGTELVVTFEEFVPHALWCKDSDSDGCFFLDENGYSFSPAPSLSGGSFLRFVAIAKDPAEHVQAFDSEHYKKVHELVALFAQSGWYVSKAELDGAGDAFFTIVDGGEFKVSLRQPAQETVENMLTVLNSEKFAHIKPGNFEYVDLRFGSKVFVNEVTIMTATSSGTSTPPTSTPTSPTPSPTPSPETAVASQPAEEAEPTPDVIQIEIPE